MVNGVSCGICFENVDEDDGRQKVYYDCESEYIECVIGLVIIAITDSAGHSRVSETMGRVYVEDGKPIGSDSESKGKKNHQSI